jgi:hypothetical protein
MKQTEAAHLFQLLRESISSNSNLFQIEVFTSSPLSNFHAWADNKPILGMLKVTENQFTDGLYLVFIDWKETNDYQLVSYPLSKTRPVFALETIHNDEFVWKYFARDQSSNKSEQVNKFLTYFPSPHVRVKLPKDARDSTLFFQDLFRLANACTQADSFCQFENPQILPKSSNTHAWIVRTGETGQFEELLHSDNVVAIGWNLPALTQFNSQEEMRAFLEITYPNETASKISNLLGQILNFSVEIKEGDLLVIPYKSIACFGIAQFRGGYWHERGKHPQASHFRSFEWIHPNIPRDQISKETLRAISSPLSVFHINTQVAWKELYQLATELSPWDGVTFPDFSTASSSNRILRSREEAPTSSKLEDLPLNLILHGPPGTGKTYELLSQIMPFFVSHEHPDHLGDKISEAFSEFSWWQIIAAVLFEFRRPATVQEIVNHDFVRLRNTFRTRSQLLNTIWNQLQSHSIPYSSDGSAKSRIEPAIFDKTPNSKWHLVGNWESEIEDVLESLRLLESNSPTLDSVKRYDFVTFHQSYSYEEFVEGLRPQIPEETNMSGGLQYIVVPGVLKRLATRARKDPKNQYALFIDEINRGNISKIFGELITIIEMDKRLGSNNPVAVTLPYSQEKFTLPKNLHIIGTMNTIDRSIALLDMAIRRRFEFRELRPNLTAIGGTDGNGNIQSTEGPPINLRRLLQVINDRIEFLIDRDHVIGHAYFCEIKTISQLEQVFNNKIIPLLTEYFYNDWEKLQMIFRDISGPGKQPTHPQIIEHTEINPKDLFSSGQYDLDLKYRYRVADGFSAAAFRKIYD